jgi:uncharacterized membrane protein
MIRWPFFLASGVLIGCVLHIVSLLAVPVLAPRDAYTRLEAISAENAPAPLDPSDPDKSLPFLDPAFEYVVCRFDLSAGPVRLRVPLASYYVSLSFYRRDGSAFFSLNDRSALGTVLDVEMRDESDEASKFLPLGAGTISVSAPEPVGFALVRAYSPSPSGAKILKEQLSKTACAPRS